MVDPKTLGVVQLLGALFGAWFGWQAQRWDSVVFAVVFLVMAVHHLAEKGAKKFK